MSEAIVISTSSGRSDWVEMCLQSVTTSIPTIVVSTGGYELGKLKWVYDNTSVDRFIFIQDSIVIRDNSLLEGLFELKGSVCLMDEPSCFGSYLGLYERETLEKTFIPDVLDKEESITQELAWTRNYVHSCGGHNYVRHPEFIRHKIVETVWRNGRVNKLYVNPLYEKWKGTWR